METDKAFDRDSYLQESLHNLSLSNETIRSIEFEECKLDGCSFIGCVFEKCRFIDCEFKGCVLSAINPMNSHITEAKFSKCKVIGCDWTKTAQIQGLDFTDCQISYSNFAMLKIPKIKMGCGTQKMVFLERGYTYFAPME